MARGARRRSRRARSDEEDPEWDPDGEDESSSACEYDDDMSSSSSSSSEEWGGVEDEEDSSSSSSSCSVRGHSMEASSSREMRPRRSKSQENEEEEGEKSDAGGESSSSSSDSSIGNTPISKKKRRIQPESSSDSEASEGEGQGSTREAPSKKTRGDHHGDRGPEEEMPSDDEDSSSSINTQDEIKAELEELKRHEKFCNRASAKKSQHRHKDDENESDGEESLSLPPVNPLCRKCSPPKSMTMHVSSKEKSTGKHFFKCHGCDEFLWADDPSVMSRMPSGPRCQCVDRQPSYPIRADGKCLWVCAKTNGKPCVFELEITDNGETSDQKEGSGEAEEEEGSSPNNDGHSDNQFVVGAESLGLLQGLFHLEYNESKEIYSGRDCRSNEPKGYYDYFQVQRAWKISAPDQMVAEFEAYREQIKPVSSHELVELRPEYDDACTAFLSGEMSERNLEPLHSDKNEKLLLHGTKPEVVASILEQSLDPQMANKFGRLARAHTLLSTQ